MRKFSSFRSSLRTPKLGPVFYQVTHLVPAKFPVLLIFPALALDLIWQRARGWKPWQIAIVSGIVFIAVLVAVEWPFAKFLLSPLAENRFFGAIYFDYGTPANSYERTHRFFEPEWGMRARKRANDRHGLRDGVRPGLGSDLAVGCVECSDEAGVHQAADTGAASAGECDRCRDTGARGMLETRMSSKL